jgi:hypothetical protein
MQHCADILISVKEEVQDAGDVETKLNMLIIQLTEYVLPRFLLVGICILIIFILC